MDDLEERLRSHAKAFEGLVALRCHDDEISDKKRSKKGLKEEKAKKAKPNPEARDQHDKSEKRKRKRKSEVEDGDVPGQKTIGKDAISGDSKKKLKKPKLDHQPELRDLQWEGVSKDFTAPQADAEELPSAKTKFDKVKKNEEKRRRREERRQAKEDEKKPDTRKAEPSIPKTGIDNATDEWEDMSADGEENNDIEAVDVSGLADEPQDEGHSSASASPAPESLLSNNSAQPSNSSNTSVDLPAGDADSPRKIRLPKIDTDILKERLRQKIEALRAARKADGPDGRPARNRQELLEARRKKEEQRKQHKKEMRKQAKEEEQRLKAEQELAQLRGSGSPMSMDHFLSPRLASPDVNFAFGRVAFDDGNLLDPTLSNFFDGRRKKGPSDPKTALQAAEAKRKRLSGLDESKRADIAEKDLWLNAKKRAHGERVRDDTDLLKKTLKRKEKMKSKSEKEWDSRIKGVEKAKEAKQRKREENLQKRREEKGVRGKKAKARLVKEREAKKKAVRRPGFEGSFRSKARK